MLFRSGAVNIANTDCCIGRGLSAINSKIGSMTYIYFVIHYLKVRFDSLNSAGTTFGSITKDDLYGLPIVVPSSDVIKMYESISKPIFDKQMNIGQEIENLTKRRDELLPLLMNGQVSVNYHLHAPLYINSLILNYTLNTRLHERNFFKCCNPPIGVQFYSRANGNGNRDSRG